MTAMTGTGGAHGPGPVEVPRLSRRHAAGSDSARGLLFTVLGEFVLPHGGAAWTSSLVDVLGRLGVEEKAARQALMRTAGDGWLTSQRHGRRTRWTLTDAGERLLTDGTRRIYGFRAVDPDWDGDVLLVLARVPETDRAARHLLRTRLGWVGLGSPSPGVWLCPHTDRATEVEQVLDAAGITDARIFVARYRGGSDGADLASMIAQAWDLDELAADYADFAEEFADDAADDPLARQVALVHAWRRFPFVDPTLPRELLPGGWTGERAASVFADRHARWLAEATTTWTALESAP